MSARLRPVCRALACCSGGNLPARMEMKTMLSMPRMISSTVSVSKLTQISGLVSQSMARNHGEAPSDCKANRKTEGKRDAHLRPGKTNEGCGGGQEQSPCSATQPIREGIADPFARRFC